MMKPTSRSGDVKRVTVQRISLKLNRAETSIKHVNTHRMINI